MALIPPRGVPDDRIGFFPAQDQADRFVLARHRQVFLGVVQVQVHLAGVRVGELTTLELDYYQATQHAVEQEKVDPVPLVVDADSLLPGHERGSRRPFPAETSPCAEQHVLQVAFAVFVFQIEKLQSIRDIGSPRATASSGRRVLLAADQHPCLVAQQRRALVELRLDLPVELRVGPATAHGLGLVKCPGVVTPYRQRPDVVEPGEGK